MLREYFVFLQTQGWTGWTVRNRASSVRAFCKWLYDEQMVETNIAERATLPKRAQVIKKPFTDDEMVRLLDNARNYKRTGVRDYAILLFLFDTGVRIAELTGLHEASFFFKERTAVVLGKGNKERMVFFSKLTAQALLKYDATRRNSECSTFFQTEEGTPLSAQGIRMILARLQKSTGIEEVHPHKFRRTFATSYLRNGGDSLMLQRSLGHTTLMMVNHYVSLVTDDLRRTHERVSPVDQLMKRQT
jgi:site-specific recombinase XerD